MRPAYFQGHNSGRDRWMVSYLDVLTILLILFVAMAAHLQSAPKKETVKAPTQAPTADTSGRSSMASIREDLEQNGLDVRQDSRGVVVSLPQALLFGPGEDRINEDALATVSAIGDVLGKISNNVSVVGHADAVPIHNKRFNNNWALAASRGLRLLELLTSRCGIEESRLSVESYGSYDPKSTNDTPDGRAINRRVEIVIRESAPRSNP